MYSSQTPLNEHTQLAPGQTQNFSCLPETAFHNLNLKKPRQQEEKVSQVWKSRNESWETSDKRQILRGPKWHRQKSERQRQVNYPVNSCGPPHKRLLHSWMYVTVLNQLLDGRLKRSSRSPDATASCLHVNFVGCCPQPISSKSFFLTAWAPILALCPLHLFLYSPCKFFQNNFRVSSPKQKSRPLQDSRPVFSIEASCWWFRLRTTRPGPFSGWHVTQETLSFRKAFSCESF